MSREIAKDTHALLRSIPVFGSLYRLANAYAYQGEPEGNAYFASLGMWWSRIFQKLTWVIAFAMVLVFLAEKSITEWTFDSASTILAIFPSILGFGIGVYALLFVMPSDFFQHLAIHKKRTSIGPEIVPVDMGYPLSIFATAMIIAVVVKVLPKSATGEFTALIALLYGLAMVVELISFLFNSSMLIQKIRSSNEET